MLFSDRGLRVIDRSALFRHSPPSGLMRQMTTNLSCVSLGTVQEVDGYFSTSGVECAVVLGEHRRHRLVYKFLNDPLTVFSFFLPLTYSSRSRSSLTHYSPASQEPVQPPWRT